MQLLPYVGHAALQIIFHFRTFLLLGAIQDW